MGTIVKAFKSDNTYITLDNELDEVVLNLNGDLSGATIPISTCEIKVRSTDIDFSEYKNYRVYFNNTLLRQFYFHSVEQYNETTMLITCYDVISLISQSTKMNSIVKYVQVDDGNGNVLKDYMTIDPYIDRPSEVNDIEIFESAFTDTISEQVSERDKLLYLFLASGVVLKVYDSSTDSTNGQNILGVEPFSTANTTYILTDENCYNGGNFIDASPVVCIYYSSPYPHSGSGEYEDDEGITYYKDGTSLNFYSLTSSSSEFGNGEGTLTIDDEYRMFAKNKQTFIPILFGYYCRRKYKGKFVGNANCYNPTQRITFETEEGTKTGHIESSKITLRNTMVCENTIVLSELTAPTYTYTESGYTRTLTFTNPNNIPVKLFWYYTTTLEISGGVTKNTQVVRVYSVSANGTCTYSTDDEPEGWISRAFVMSIDERKASSTIEFTIQQF